MVSFGSIIILAGVAIGGLVFFSANGIDRVKAFGQTLKPTQGNEVQTPSIPKIQETLTTTQSGGVALANTKSSGVLTGTIQSKRRFQNPITERFEVQASLLPEVQRSSNLRLVNGTLIIGAPTKALTRNLTGKGTAQTSSGSVAILSEAKRAEVRDRALTKVQVEDVKKLDARRKRAIDRGINPNIKLSGSELVLRKAEQEEISKNLLRDRFGGQTFVGGKLFAKAGFASGGLTPALRAERARNAGPTIGKMGQEIENLGRNGSSIIRARTMSRVEQALAFNRRVISAKKAGTAIPVFGGFSSGSGPGGTF